MIDIHATVRLRPIRIGFLVRPNDLASIKAIMRYCTCLWGGMYNPIIPVFTSPPKDWRSEPFERARGLNVAKGYIRFFEPDIYVEAERGLLDDVGLGAYRKRPAVYPDVRLLSELLKPEKHRDFCEPAFGLNVQDVHSHLYKTAQQFAPREPRKNLLVKAEKSSGVTEALFGVFPTQKSVRNIASGYKHAFEPTTLDAGPDAWEKWLRGATTPLTVTNYHIDAQRNWHHDPIIFVFDPSRPTDLIDAWNIRLEPSPVALVPVDWFEPLKDIIFTLLKSEHRRVQGNPFNLMHHATIEFGRSIPKSQAEDLISKLRPGLPAGALAVKMWRNSIWVDHHYEQRIHRERRRIVTAGERRMKVEVRDGEQRTTFDTLSPDFARRYGGRDHRWVNPLTLSSYGDPVATALPFNLTDPNWPPLGLGGERVLVGSEGWIFTQRYKDSSQWVQLLSHEEAVIGTLARYGIDAKLSEPGHIAKQMADHVGGLWGVHLLADIETLGLLNKMAGGVRRRVVGAHLNEESFELRSASWKIWKDLIARRLEHKRLPKVGLESFTSKNVIRLGLETHCPNCQAKNWSSLKTVDYEIICERCLRGYPFPQASLQDHNRNWAYRVVGPFSVPDYGRGAYCALLTLRLLKGFDTSMGDMTFVTAMELKFDNRHFEVDFLALKGPERHDLTIEPEIVIGEAKSFGDGQLIKPHDLTQLKAVAARLPGAVMVVSVLRDHFLPAEKKILEKLAKWGRRLNGDGQPTNPIILLTAKELMFDYLLSATWTELGGDYAKFGTYDHTHDLRSMADATQQLYLGMPSFSVSLQSRWEKRRRRSAKGSGPLRGT